MSISMMVCGCTFAGGIAGIFVPVETAYAATIAIVGVIACFTKKRPSGKVGDYSGLEALWLSAACVGALSALTAKFLLYSIFF